MRHYCISVPWFQSFSSLQCNAVAVLDEEARESWSESKGAKVEDGLLVQIRKLLKFIILNSRRKNDCIPDVRLDHKESENLKLSWPEEWRVAKMAGILRPLFFTRVLVALLTEHLKQATRL